GLHTLFSFFFFFQAEDGIRDGHVTGVQTCALPICSFALVRSHPCILLPQWAYRSRHSAAYNGEKGCPYCLGGGRSSPERHWSYRSEERRVGKECRSRWSASH